MPALEALACSCPVVGVSGTPIEEVCGPLGFFAEKYSSSSLARAISLSLELNRDDYRPGAISQASRHSWEAAAKSYKKAIKIAVSR